jgi:murein DD-endopeptidase MepM/ murein hydrolase activator NlpD
LSPAYRYKKIETEFAERLKKRLRRMGDGIASFCRLVVQKGKQRFTVMFIPHSEKRIFNFQISVFTMIFILFILTVLVLSFFGLSTHFTSTNKRFQQVSENLLASESSLEGFKDEIVELRKIAREFKTRMEGVLDAVGTEGAQNFLQRGIGGELGSFVALNDLQEESLQDLIDLRSLRAYLDSAAEPLAEIQSVLDAQRELLVEIPTLWPIKGVRGNITNTFGPARHPFTGRWYLHKGIDIAWGFGVPIVATANGKVVQTEFEPMGLGNYVVVRHKYGFYTRYGHLNNWTVVKGQEVRRGQVIGYMGSSGLSTGPHVHYEVRIGTHVVDPLQFLSIKSPLINKSLPGAR